MDKVITKVSRASNVDRTRNMFWGRGTVITAPEAFFAFYGGSDEFDNLRSPSEFGNADKLDLSSWKDPRMKETLLKKTATDPAHQEEDEVVEEDEVLGIEKAEDIPAPAVKKRGRPPGIKKTK